MNGRTKAELEIELAEALAEIEDLESRFDEIVRIASDDDETDGEDDEPETGDD